MLFKLHDIIANEPVTHSLHSIDSLYCTGLCCIMSRLDYMSQLQERVTTMHPIRNRKFQSIMIIYNRVVCHKVRSLKVRCKDTINIPNCQTFRGIFQEKREARKSPDCI